MPEKINRTKHSVSLLASLRIYNSHKPLFELMDSPKKDWLMVKNMQTREAIVIHRKQIPGLIKDNQQYLNVKFEFDESD